VLVWLSSAITHHACKSSPFHLCHTTAHHEFFTRSPYHRSCNCNRFCVQRSYSH
jgi:hypothetical protein